MDEEEDDLYGENGAGQGRANDPIHNAPPSEEGEEDEEEEMDEDDSDSDIEIVTERKEGDIPAVVPGIATQRPDGPTSAAIPIVAPPQQTSTATSKVEIDSTGRAQVTVQSGLQYPEIRTSTIDVNGNPIYPPLGKPITEVEIDADLVEHEKPWRRPGADQSDYFNYGFDEFTWSTYTLRQKNMTDALTEQKSENTKFEMMFGGGGGGMMPGMPGQDAMAAMGGMGGGMGMPSQQEFQSAMMEAMRLQGVSDPSKVDFNAFMSQLQGGGMMGQQSVPSGPSAQQQNYGGGNWQQGGGYGRGKRGQRWQ